MSCLVHFILFCLVSTGKKFFMISLIRVHICLARDGVVSNIRNRFVLPGARQSRVNNNRTVIVEDAFLQQIAAQYLAGNNSGAQSARQPLPDKPAAPVSYQDRDDDHYSPAELVQPHAHRPTSLMTGYLNSDLPAAWRTGRTVEPSPQVLPSSLLPPFESPKPFATNDHLASMATVPNTGGVITETSTSTPAKPHAGPKKSSLQEYKLLEDAFWKQTEAIVAAKALTQPRAMAQAVPPPSAPRAPAAFAVKYQQQMTKGDHQAMQAPNLAKMKAGLGTAAMQNNGHNQTASMVTSLPSRAGLPPKPVISMAPSPPTSPPAVFTSFHIRVNRSPPIISSKTWTWTPDDRKDDTRTHSVLEKKSRFDVPPPAEQQPGASTIVQDPTALGRDPAGSTSHKAVAGPATAPDALDGKRKLAEAEVLLEEAENSQRGKDWAKSQKGQRLSLLLAQVDTRASDHEQKFAEMLGLLEEAADDQYGKALAELTSRERMSLLDRYTTGIKERPRGTDAKRKRQE